MPEISLQARLAKHLLRLITHRRTPFTIESRRTWPDLAGRLRQKRHPDLAIVPATVGGVDCEWVYRRPAIAGPADSLPPEEEPAPLSLADEPAPETLPLPGSRPPDAAAAAEPAPSPAPADSLPPAEDSAPLILADEPLPETLLLPGSRLPDAAAAAAAAEPAVPAPTDGQAVLVYFHGGGYVTGSLLSARVLSTNLAFEMPVRLLSVNYRLAPEHPFPAALMDALAVYDALLAEGWEPARIGLIGDSAGGGLALAMAMAIRDRGLPLPACLVLISPWTDLTGRSPSFKEKAADDVMLIPEEITRFALFYAGENRPDNPYISPVYGRFDKLPPILIHAGSDEMLLDDARRAVAAAAAAGVDVTFKIWPGLFHVFSLAADLLPEARESMDEIMDFLCRHLVEKTASIVHKSSTDAN